MRFEKTVFVTGATSGIGRALARLLAKSGTSLAVCGRSEEKLAMLLPELKAAGASQVFGHAFDCTDFQAVRSFVTEAAAAIGVPGVLINCAGANWERAPVFSLEIEQLNKMFALNCLAPLAFTQASHALMLTSGGGHIVNVISSAVLFSNTGIASYTASKSALDAWTKIYRKETKSTGIRVSAVYPGGTDSAFRPNDRPDYMRPESVAQAIFQILLLPPDATVHELILRPEVEENF